MLSRKNEVKKFRKSKLLNLIWATPSWVHILIRRISRRVLVRSEPLDDDYCLGYRWDNANKWETSNSGISSQGE